jgi:hypothetical protein
MARRKTRDEPTVERRYFDSSSMPSNKLDRRRAALIAATTGVLLVVVGLGLAWLVRGGAPGRPRAVIVDQLASTNPNPAFVERATKMLLDAGYRVDYVPPEDVTVNYYRDLPSRGYTFIIIRSHSYGVRQYYDPLTGAAHTLQQGGLFTDEPYNDETHVAEQSQHDLDAGTYNGAPGRTFGIAPSFIVSDMHGHFHHATMLVMGCDSLSTHVLAQAFVGRGVDRFIGWDNQVTAEHTDAAMRELLELLLVDHEAPIPAVAQESVKAGPDPVYGGKLATYP